jgi:hypothetical protein
MTIPVHNFFVNRTLVPRAGGNVVRSKKQGGWPYKILQPWDLV